MRGEQAVAVPMDKNAHPGPLAAQPVGHAAAHGPPAPAHPCVWVLLGQGAGGNDQLQGLARALGWPFAAKRMRYNILNYIPNPLLGASCVTIDRRHSDPLVAPWPDLVIAASRRAAPVARWIKRQSAGRTRLVHLLHAQAPLRHFDLVVTMPHYRLPERPNVLHTLLPLNVPDAQRLRDAADVWRARLADLPRPWIAVLVGGDSSTYRLSAAVAAELGVRASAAARAAGGSLLITTSPRTPPAAAASLVRSIDSPAHVYLWHEHRGSDNPYPAYLALADRFIVTADSASQLAEACASGRPLDLFDWPPRRRWLPGLLGPLRALPGAARLHDAAVAVGLIKPRRDFRALHQALQARGFLSGRSPDQPSPALEELGRTVARIRQLMDQPHLAPGSSTQSATP
jgi:mitochondrial fission protein ELM1